jgi:hypothetical protein
MCAALDAEVEAFRSRSLTEEAFSYLWLDATYLKVREHGRVVSMAAPSRRLSSVASMLDASTSRAAHRRRIVSGPQLSQLATSGFVT